MERHFDEELKDLSKDLLLMGSMVEELIQKAVQALVKRDDNLANQVVADDKKIDEMQLKIDETCLTLLALRQPTAIDLRTIASTMKIVTDLERMGDQAVNIAESAMQANKQAPLKTFEDLPPMVNAVQKMVHEALDAFVNRSAETAQAVCRSDDKVDTLYHRIFGELLSLMKENGDNVSRALHLLLVARNLERIGDHATNIAEDVVYLVQGKDIRHHHEV